MSRGNYMEIRARPSGLIFVRKIRKDAYMETIISACISAAVTLLVCLISNHGQQEKTRALMEYKLNELTKRVDKHNNTIERTYHLEEQMALQEEKMKVANHRISDLEGKVE
ncbi:Uncharacterised protein [uncultured Eubacterium sp.]|nr:Uncharacterised protein [uncultured Eubacterium sp.]